MKSPVSYAHLPGNNISSAGTFWCPSLSNRVKKLGVGSRIERSSRLARRYILLTYFAEKEGGSKTNSMIRRTKLFAMLKGSVPIFFWLQINGESSL
jgi:hypothetical protein